ncbi:hypothetical protein IQ07DRAFT_606026 [Pyrenochaeta sp. DS3sAY3a]|nr:hypothetical protein IQ07DRAFT_606026 [Pyrenochaeta sp. DS3sAY3a]
MAVVVPTSAIACAKACRMETAVPSKLKKFRYGWCGSTSGHCGTGCRPNFGTCSSFSASSIIRSSTLRTSASSTRISSSAIASPSIRVSNNARCGSANGATGGFTCKGSTYGNCCSQYSYCGSTSAYCGTGCQPGFGTCSGISSSVRSSSTSPAHSSSSSVTSSLISSSAILSSTSSVSSALPSSTPIITPPTQLVLNPSFELGDGTDPSFWTIERLYVIDAGATGRFQTNPRTGDYSIRGRGQPNGGYDVTLSQTVTVVPGASYNIEVFAKQTTDGYCSISIYFGNQVIREFAPPGTAYTSIAGVVNIPVGDPVRQALFVDGACSLPSDSAANYDLFIDDVTMTLVV